MLKGAQKRMIVVKTADSRIFEEAYFVVKTNYDCEELDVVAEAERIVDAAMLRGKGKKRADGGNRNLLFGIVGMIVGAVVGVLATLIFVILI